MRVATAEKILKLFGIKGGKPDAYGMTHKQKEYELAYKVMELIVEDASDSEIIAQVQKRTNLMPMPKCEDCGRLLEPCYSTNGVLDSWNCPLSDPWTGKHKWLKKKKSKLGSRLRSISKSIKKITSF